MRPQKLLRYVPNSTDQVKKFKVMIWVTLFVSIFYVTVHRSFCTLIALLKGLSYSKGAHKNLSIEKGNIKATSIA